VALQLLADQAKSASKHVLRLPGPFNFSRLNNEAVRVAKGELLCFLNNDIEPLDGSWLTNLVTRAVEPDVGAVGAMLLYPDGSIQHAGVAIGIGGAAGHVQKGVMPDSTRGDFRYFATRRVSAVTAACLVVSRDKFLSVGGFDEQAFPVAFNDVDFCLKLNSRRLRNMFVAESRLIHHESKSRGQDDNPEKRERFARELRQLQQRWETQTYTDPWYSPLLSRASERCLLQI
jgi:GT2 family glycosyltransferase